MTAAPVPLSLSNCLAPLLKQLKRRAPAQAHRVRITGRMASPENRDGTPGRSLATLFVSRSSILDAQAISQLRLGNCPASGKSMGLCCIVQKAGSICSGRCSIPESPLGSLRRPITGKGLVLSLWVGSCNKLRLVEGPEFFLLKNLSDRKCGSHGLWQRIAGSLCVLDSPTLQLPAPSRSDLS
ncbi:hypothetical protein BDW62DRAFT_58660 [Aspergillus aurantiobrunneus]